MTDRVAPEVRSQMMAGIRSKNTKPEMQIRRLLHRMGFRFRLHDSKLPGTPDLVLKKYGAVILIHGCFWHLHDCTYFKWPRTRPEFWRDKISKNKKNDLLALHDLEMHGWRVCIVWECALKEAGVNLDGIGAAIAGWIRSDKKKLEVSG